MEGRAMSDFNIQAKELFGRYCRIEMFRYGVPNEFYIHKIVSQSRQNTYCDVPLRWNSQPEKHEAKKGVPFPDNLEEVIWVVQCGIDETHVFPVALKDVELLDDELRAELKGMQEENAKLRTLLSGALIAMGFNGRQYLDEYLREEEGTTLIQELKNVGIEVN